MTTRIRSGSLDRTITLQRAEDLVDASGQVSSTWSTIANVRAQVVTDAVQETLQAPGTVTEETITVRIWHRQAFTVADRILYAGKAFDVRDVLEIGRRHGLELRAVASA